MIYLFHVRRLEVGGVEHAGKTNARLRHMYTLKKSGGASVGDSSDGARDHTLENDQLVLQTQTIHMHSFQMTHALAQTVARSLRSQSSEF